VHVLASLTPTQGLGLVITMYALPPLLKDLTALSFDYTEPLGDAFYLITRIPRKGKQPPPKEAPKAKATAPKSKEAPKAAAAAVTTEEAAPKAGGATRRKSAAKKKA
jgi:hypothetical protein